MALQPWLQALLDPAEWGEPVPPIALQHARPGTAVTLTVAADADLLRLSVANRGEPVPAPVAAHLFEPFASGRSDGNGLGLALVREIARAHGGEVRYAHHDGVTSFLLELPWRAS